MTQGFLQLELDEDSKKKTVFTIFTGVFEYNVASWGLTYVPGHFWFAVGNIFAELRQIINSFFDDFIGHTKGKNQREALGQAQTENPFVWTESCQTAFNIRRGMASEDPYLRAPVGPGHENYVRDRRRFRRSNWGCVTPIGLDWWQDWGER